MYGFFSLVLAFPQYKFENPVIFGKAQGVLFNDLRGLKKGPDGFMWMGSSEGICRFDGQVLKAFKLTENYNMAPFTNSVLCVLPVENEIWAGTTQGVSVMDTRTYTFRHYQFTDNEKSKTIKKHVDQHVHVLFRDRSGKIWVGTRNRGVYMYDRENDNFRAFHYKRDQFPALFPALGSDNAVLSMEASQTNDSIIWAGTSAGMQEINKYTGHVTLYVYPKDNKDYQVALNAFRRLYHHDNGLLYVGSWAAGVNVFDPVTKTFTPLTSTHESGKRLLNSAVSGIHRKSDHEIWITSLLGLAVYDSQLKDVTWYKFNNNVDNKFYGVDVIDEKNRVWLTTIVGLQYFDPVMQQFSRYSFRHLTGGEWAFAFYIIADKPGNNITVCPRATDGLLNFNRSENQWTKYPFPPGKTFKAEKDAIRGFARLPSGDFIISADRGIFKFSEKTKRITALEHELPFTLSRRGEIMLDHSGNLWISDEAQGMIKWRPGTKQFRIYKTTDMEGDTSTLVARRFLNFFEDSRGNIWFQRFGGFALYVAAKDSILTFLYEKNEKNTFPGVFDFAEDRKGRVWMTGEDGWIGYGLAKDPEKGIVYKQSRKDRGTPAYLPGLATDKNGDVWGYNAKELYKINTDNLKIETYSFAYGLEEVDYFHFSFLPSGELIFGGRTDITITSPSELTRNTEIPVPFIDEVEVLNQPLTFIAGGSTLRLNHDQNFFSVRFSAKAYTLANDVKFQHRLKGFEDWSDVTQRRFANYTNVPGGDYVFQLKVANNEGTWNEKILELPVHIATVWWKTARFRLAAIILLFTILVSLYRNRVDQIRKKEQIRSQYEKKLANVEMSALLAQMNPHFLFNSLNSIDSYIIRNESKKASEYLNNFARLMRLILQNSRSNYISLKDELEALDLYMQMESLRFANRFSYELKVDPDIDTSSTLIPPMLIQPYVENAIWHGLMHKKEGEEGKVEITISRKDESLYCIIHDNGIGREKASALKAQKPGNRKRSMGMQITKDRIEMINKLYNTNTSMHVIDLHDEQGNATGTRVELIIPV